MKEEIRQVSSNELTGVIRDLKSVVRNIRFHHDTVFNDISEQDISELDEIRMKLKTLRDKILK